MKTLTPHPYQEDPGVPGTCRCGRTDPKHVNAVHQMPAVPKDVIAAEARRLGENDE
jgi:hypothetical protein